MRAIFERLGSRGEEKTIAVGAAGPYILVFATAKQAPLPLELGPMTAPAASIDPAEIARFSAMADEWWDPMGKFRPLHALNPPRLQFLRDRLAGHFGRDALGPAPLAGLRLLDIGCGGGLVSEPMARLGATVVGVDASERNIAIASHHAGQSGLAIDYRCSSAEDLAAAGESFDAVLALEIIEHVADLESFVGACAQLIRPGGAAVFSTLNRTPQSYLLGIVGAEYVLRWLPVGTHQWNRFVRPSELAAALRPRGLTITAMDGLGYQPIQQRWRLTKDLSVNYLAFAVKC
jgi:2-polyprenyl-6-hydroxyphenyl methylase / 3-demethylubiquinone-9 3-methyltransferase